MIIGYIYKTTNKINGKIYIGQKHKSILDENYFGSGILIKRALNKYGKENFYVEVLEYCETQEELDKSELKWINLLNSRDRKIGYNIAYGGQGGGFLCDDFIERLSGENYYLNKYSEEDREKHLNTYRRGFNFWKSKGFKTQEEVNAWVKKNWTGENHSHRKFKTEKEYEEWLDSKYRGKNFWLNRCLSTEERERYIKENYKGENNPIRKGKTLEEYEVWLNENRRNENAPKAIYHYVIITSENRKIEGNCLKVLCKENDLNLQVILKLIEVSEGKRQSYKSREEKYEGWVAYKFLRKDLV